jgi:hypothetical protein
MAKKNNANSKPEHQLRYFRAMVTKIDGEHPRIENFQRPRKGRNVDCPAKEIEDREESP